MCNCWEKINKELATKGLRISSACEGMRMAGSELKWLCGIPLQTLEGKKPARGQPKIIEMTHCPFCGKKME